MYVTEIATAAMLDVSIEPLLAGEYKLVTKGNFFFDWKKERINDVVKLRLTNSNDILGLMSLIYYPGERRIFINLIAVSKENRGNSKKYDRIVGNLIAYACRKSYEYYAEDGSVSLIPKSALRKHYAQKYGMLIAGQHLVLVKDCLVQLMKEYEV